MCAKGKHDGTHALLGVNCQKNEAELSNQSTDHSDHYRPSVAPHWLLSPFTKAINKLVASPSRIYPPSPIKSLTLAKRLLSRFRGQTPTAVCCWAKFRSFSHCGVSNMVWSHSHHSISLTLTLYISVTFPPSSLLLRLRHSAATMLRPHYRIASQLVTWHSWFFDILWMLGLNWVILGNRERL